MDNDFRSVSSDVGCRVRLVNVFFPSLRQNWTGSRTAEVATIVGLELDPLWVRIVYCLVPGTWSYKAGCVGELCGVH